MDPIHVLAAIVVFVLAFTVYTYNRLVGLRNMADTALANIDTLLQKRFDLVPNLVDTVKAYMKHEQEVLETVTKARTEYLNSSSMKENAAADEKASRAIKTLFAVSENYPELKASQNFMMLQEELVGIENKLAYARQRYNRTVMIINMVVQKFPTNILARLFNFKTRDFFAVESGDVRNVPGIKMQGGAKS